jgi:isoleucyl-tRNA synthetase
MYEKVSTDLKFVEREKKVEAFWKEHDIFEKSIKNREGCPTYMFYDGPPTANGKPHIGHVLTRVIKDLIPRYRAMKGYMVPRKAGWDTHGLPVELEVEKKLGLNGKEQIEAYGLEPFIAHCKESVWNYKGMWEDFSDTVGFWADMEHPYVTYHNEYIESEWWALKEIWEKGLLYKGFKTVPYCPRCGTPLSSHEVDQGYKVVKERSAVAKFRMKGESGPHGEDVWFLAWTTTPWTLPSNVALCVNPDEKYVKALAGGEVYILAEALCETVLGGAGGAKPAGGADAAGHAAGGGKHGSGAADEARHAAGGAGQAIPGAAAAGQPGPQDCGAEAGHADAGTPAASAADELKHASAAPAAPYEVLAAYTGKDLEHMEYEPLFPFAHPKEKAFYVVCDKYVTLTDGTGIVHIAPAFGEDDNRIGRVYGLPFVQFVDGKGEMTKETAWPGVFCKDADKLILDELRSRGQLFSAPSYEHNYPHCWRCDTPLIYYARESWFIKMTAVRDDLLRNNATINWVPPNIGKGRFGDWLENVQDWGLSRNRYWGTPLNIWECACGHQHSIGSIRELREMSPNCPEGIELHRPFIDEVTITCPKCGAQMRRVPEVIDCWFDSGAMPFAQHHYPFENDELFWKQFPADFISEAVDQTRGWFYSLLAISTLIFNKSSFRNCIVMGHVLDKNGVKMSKSAGNAVDPFEALEKHGADAIRWYFYVNSAPWLPNRFYDQAVTECQRKFMGTLWNTYAFYVLYADIDAFDPTRHTLEYAQLPVMDRWALSKLHSLVAKVDDDLANYRVTEAARALQGYVEELSNWYVRRCRDRFWGPGMERDKVNAYMTLYTALTTLCKAAAPMVPFITENIYQNIVRTVDPGAPESIHLCDFPASEASYIDKELEAQMDLAMKIVVMGRAARNTAGLKNRQPIGEMFVKSEAQLSPYYLDIAAEELNVKRITFTGDVRAYTTYTFKPQLKTVGPKYGKHLGHIKNVLAGLDGNAAMDELKASSGLSFAVDGTDIVLGEEDLLIEVAHTPGYVAETDAKMAVVLDVRLTPELIEEGYVREIVSKVQTMRKEAGFEVVNHIRLYMTGNDKLARVATSNGARIRKEVLADALELGADGGGLHAADAGKAAGHEAAAAAQGADAVTAHSGASAGFAAWNSVALGMIGNKDNDKGGFAGAIYTKAWDINGEPVALGVEKIS